MKQMNQMNQTILSQVSESGALPFMVILGLVLVLSLAYLLTQRRWSPTARRLKALEGLRIGGGGKNRFHAGHEHRIAGDEDRKGSQGLPIIDNVIAILSEAVSRLPLLGEKDRQNVRDLLFRAGFRRDDALGIFMTAKVGSGLLGTAGFIFLVTHFGLFAETQILKVGAALAGMIFGSLLPEFIVKNAAAARQTRILRALPDALDLMVICTESGLGLDPTIDRVARELKLSAPELANELAVMSHEMRILPKREQALENFATRNDYRIVRGLMSTLIQTLRYGTSLAHSLRVLANETRNARMLAVEEKAARLPAMMSIPLICFMLPAVFLVIGGPAAAQIIKNFF